MTESGVLTFWLSTRCPVPQQFCCYNGLLEIWTQCLDGGPGRGAADGLSGQNSTCRDNLDETGQDETKTLESTSRLEQVATVAVCTVIRVIDTSVELGRPLVTTVRNSGTMLEFVFQNFLNWNLNPQKIFMMKSPPRDQVLIFVKNCLFLTVRMPLWLIALMPVVCSKWKTVKSSQSWALL